MPSLMISILSMKCLCRSVTLTPESFSRVSTESTQMMSCGSSTLIHSGMQEPQKRFLEMFQSFASASQFANRWVPMAAGIQVVWALFFSSLSWRSSTRTYQASIAL